MGHRLELKNQKAKNKPKNSYLNTGMVMTTGLDWSILRASSQIEVFTYTKGGKLGTKTQSICVNQKEKTQWTEFLLLWDLFLNLGFDCISSCGISHQPCWVDIFFSFFQHNMFIGYLGISHHIPWPHSVPSPSIFTPNPCDLPKVKIKIRIEKKF